MRGKHEQGAVDTVLALLEESPRRIEAAVAGLSPQQLRSRPGPDEWSAAEVLAHLRSCEEVWGDCIRTILRDDHPTIRAVNPRTWIEGTDYPAQEFAPAYRRFSAHRRGLLDDLRALSPADWTRSATVVGAGRPLERTVLSYATRLAEHERSHVGQLRRLAAAVSGG